MTDSVHGVHYLIDYYALFGIPRTASAEEIKLAYWEKQKQYHPGRFSSAAQELLALAEKKARLFTEAWEILNDEVKKKAYDEKLTAWTKPLSTNGEVILDLSSSEFSLERLLKTSALDSEELRREEELIAIQQSGFDQETFDFVSEQYKAAGENPSSKLKKSYFQQLEKRQLYLSILEGFTWSALGIHNPAPESELQHLDTVQTQVTDLKTKVSEAIQNEVLMITIGAQGLLPAPDGIDSAANPEQVLAHYKAKIGTHVEVQAEKLQAFATERDKIITEQFDLISNIQYHPATRVYTRKVIIEAKKQTATFRFSFEIGEKVEKNRNVKAIDVGDLSILEDPQIATEWIEQGFTILSFTFVPEIEVKSQVEKVLLHYINTVVEKQEEVLERISKSSSN